MGPMGGPWGPMGAPWGPWALFGPYGPWGPTGPVGRRAPTTLFANVVLDLLFLMPSESFVVTAPFLEVDQVQVGILLGGQEPTSQDTRK